MGKKYSQMSPANQQFIYKNAGKIAVPTMAKILKCKPERIKDWAYSHGLSLKLIK